MTLDEAIARALEEAGEYQERADSAELIDILDGLDVESCKECAADHRQLAEWLTDYKELKNSIGAVKLSNIKEALELIRALKAELNEWKENPFLKIRTECRKNYYCNDCTFINHCPFAYGNRVAAKYPMDWTVY